MHDVVIVDIGRCGLLNLVVIFLVQIFQCIRNSLPSNRRRHKGPRVHQWLQDILIPLALPAPIRYHGINIFLLFLRCLLLLPLPIIDIAVSNRLQAWLVELLIQVLVDVRDDLPPLLPQQLLFLAHLRRFLFTLASCCFFAIFRLCFGIRRILYILLGTFIS